MKNSLNYKEIKSILFVCMGNICRSPTAEAIFRHKAKQANLNLSLDSAGTLGAHAREKPDHRAIKVGNDKGYSFDGIKARKVIEKDFSQFDLILAMDEDNVRNLKKVARPEYHHKIMLFLDFIEGIEEREVPDPYYGGAGGFRYVVELIEAASDSLVGKLVESRTVNS
ncbi:low molecular weight protein-tyrosine-phosphatase [Thalassotalea atypica]|uniref:low molecular weight protein-tyrosine-phosphatase n=1 Tax=Thalassotalea atypica TaxID=2054316 RepID=UPI002573166A|nr:low molecular weight protein-tyrosine-phosphatase [Thalassotalea atypica]